MARKQSLSDLLQQEAQKFTPPEGESAIEVAAEEIAQEQTSTSTDDEESSVEVSESTSTRRTNPTKSDLEVTIKELTNTLETSNKKEVSLQQQIVDLQSKLSQQKALASEQEALTKQLTKELHETKQTALQLAEANSKLIEEINASNQAAEAKELVEANSKLIKETSAIKPVKENYNPLNYKKSHRSSEKLAQNQPDEAADTSNQMWLLD